MARILLKHGQVFHLLCLCLVSVVFFLFVFSVKVSGDVEYLRAVPAEAKTTTVWLSTIKQSGNNYWAKLKETLGRGHSRFFPPNIDFRGKDDPTMGTGEKVKEAVTRSFEHSKDTVEEAARSAAEVACDAAGAVKEKVKRSVSGGETTQHQSETTSSLLPSSNLVSSRSQSSDRRPSHVGDLYEIDTSASQSPSDPLIQKLEDAVHRIFVRRSAPDWLPFVPGASYWVPPPGSGSQTHGIAQLVAKLANPLTDEESLSANSSHGWPSSDYFLKGVQPRLMETKSETTLNTESHSEDEEG
ncbi:unnamed protein product [Arabis nemorensis]|uniref:Transmembrane protein n=1 Tax=Arabis nemorensis TaxID=586526 RepID=A0A565ARB0_9BRAS|nr:unnamed protein product [Arabis nemorensis]